MTDYFLSLYESGYVAVYKRLIKELVKKRLILFIVSGMDKFWSECHSNFLKVVRI